MCFTGAPNRYCPNAKMKMIPAVWHFSALSEMRRGGWKQHGLKHALNLVPNLIVY